MGDGTARKVEEAFGLGLYWMDTDHAGTRPAAPRSAPAVAATRAGTSSVATSTAASAAPSTAQPAAATYATGGASIELANPAYDLAGTRPMQGQVPLISWVQAGALAEVIDNFAPGDADIWHACPRRHGPHTFALRVRGVSMEPKFQDGDIIFVDPDVAAEHGRNVVVRFEDSKEATFKQLLIEGEHQYLRALNPDWPGPRLIEIDASATICGVVIGKFVEF
ncbi:peptidase S24 [Achromobacter sp. HZ28]|nr:peptidase S24 [Achromobacter sp. HZ34]OWT79773.1 peptidase S24 [Achromobacter sp. HZ28]